MLCRYRHSCHWNGGRNTIEPLLRYCELKGYCPPDMDEYGWVRLCQVAGNFFGGEEWLVHEIDGDAGILFSDGSRSCGKAHVSKAVADRLERYWHECKHPEERFAGDGDGRVFGPRDPGRCPECDSASIEGGIAEFGGRFVCQHVSCPECGFRWSDAYGYANYLPLE